MRHPIAILLLAGAAAAALAGGAVAQELSRDAVLDAVAKWEEAVNAGDAAAAAEFYAEDAVLMPPGAERIEGRENIEAFWRDFLKDGPKLDVETLDVATGGGIAYEVGTVTVTMPGAEAPLTGKYIWTWEGTESGEPKVKADIWNLDAAPQQ